MKIPIVGVLGSGSEEHAAVSEPLGRSLALAGYHLLTGGGQGVMEAVTRALVRIPQGEGAGKRRGLALGIIPGEISRGPDKSLEYKTKNGYPNPEVEVAIHSSATKRFGREKAHEPATTL